MSYVFCAKAAVPLMRRGKGGAIVNVAAARSIVAGGGSLQYDTAKVLVTVSEQLDCRLSDGRQ